MKKAKITPRLLLKYGFVNVTDNKFESYPIHEYWVKKGVCLFYNNGDNDNFLFGYAEMRMSKYYAVGIRWISTMEELKEVYLCLNGWKLVTEPTRTTTG